MRRTPPLPDTVLLRYMRLVHDSVSMIAQNLHQCAPDVPALDDTAHLICVNHCMSTEYRTSLLRQSLRPRTGQAGHEMGSRESHSPQARGDVNVPSCSSIRGPADAPPGTRRSRQPLPSPPLDSWTSKYKVSPFRGSAVAISVGMQRPELGGARKERTLSFDNIAMQAKQAEAASSSVGGDPSAAMPRLSLEGERAGSPESGVQPRATAGAAGAALVPRSSSMWKGRRHRSVSWDDLPQKLPAGAPSEISSVEEEGSGTSYSSFDSSSDQRSRSSSICSIDEDSQVSRFGWQPDAEVQRCSIPGCDRQFSLVHRRHHCRKCGRVVCSNCSKRRIRSERVCLECCQLGAVSEETTEAHTPAAFEPASNASGAAAGHGAGLLDGRSPRESPAATPIARSPLESPALHGIKVPVSALPSAVAAKLSQVNRASAGASGAGALHWKDMGPLGVGAAGGFGGASQEWTSGSGSHEWEDSWQMQAGPGTTSASPKATLLDEGEPLGDSSSDDASSAEDDSVVAQYCMQQQTSGWAGGGGSGTKGSALPLRRVSSGIVDTRTGALSKSTSASSLKGYGASLWRSSSSSSIASLARGSAPALSAGVGGGRADGAL